VNSPSVELKRTDSLDFWTAQKAWDAIPEHLRTFAIKSSGYCSVKDTVKPDDRERVCSVCHSPRGVPGYVRFDWPIGHIYFGRAIRCPRCNS